MYELNLIKDKAKARQRRRIVFLCIVSVLFLGGLLSIFVGSLYWRETIVLDSVAAHAADLERSIQERQADLAVRGPKTLKRRNALIRAQQEDERVLADLQAYSPLLMDLHRERPTTAEYWYNEIDIGLTPTTTGRGTTADPQAAAEALLGGRTLSARGWLQIEASDIMSQNELDSVAGRMQNLLQVVGRPGFSLDAASQSGQSIGTGVRQGEDRRYAQFQLRAARATFRGVVD
jgi:hypothetical protein